MEVNEAIQEVKLLLVPQWL